MFNLQMRKLRLGVEYQPKVGLRKFSKQHSEPGGGSLTTSCLAEVGVGWGRVGQGGPLHTWLQQQGAGCTFPISSANPFG